MQRCYLEGLQQDGTISSSDDADQAPGFEPAVRTDVDAGTDVIDLAAMRAQLEAERDQRTKGGA